VFQLSPSGTYKVMHSFTGGSDGAQPNSSLVRTASGSIFGTSNSVAYMLSPTAKLTVLHQFVGGVNDGFAPTPGLAMDKFGTLYGSTYASGSGCCNGVGTIFKISH
jgi:hypothetical protein